MATAHHQEDVASYVVPPQFIDGTIALKNGMPINPQLELIII